MDLIDTLRVITIISLASAIQSAVGFAFALFATPLLLWTGVPLPNAITIVAVCSCAQSILGATHLRKSVPWRPFLTATPIRLIALAAGLLILKRITALDVGDIRMVVGFVLCVLVGIQSFGWFRPAGEIHWIWSGLAFTSSGLLAGMCGMGGPPLVLWTMAKQWPVKTSRGFLFANFAALVPVQLGLLYLSFGTVILHSLGTAGLLTPAVFLGALIGLPIGNRLPKPLLRTIVNLILFVIGISSIVGPLVDRFR